MEIRYGRNDFIENNALNFVFYLMDDQQHLRLDYVIQDIYEITQLPHDIVMKVIDLYNQRSQSRKEYLTGRLFTCSFLNQEWAEYYQSEISKIEHHYVRVREREAFLEHHNGESSVVVETFE